MAPSSPSSELPQTVLDRSDRLALSLRNPTAGRGVCPRCFGFHDPAGSTARSAAHALKDAGASVVACVTIGRRLRPDWPPATGATGKRYDQLPKTFDWNTCAVHVPPPPEAPAPTSAW